VWEWEVDKSQSGFVAFDQQRPGVPLTGTPASGRGRKFFCSDPPPPATDERGLSAAGCGGRARGCRGAASSASSTAARSPSCPWPTSTAALAPYPRCAAHISHRHFVILRLCGSEMCYGFVGCHNGFVGEVGKDDDGRSSDARAGDCAASRPSGVPCDLR
jgi:hypothetical protein